MTTAAFLSAAELHSVPSAGLTVHEWGTFTSVAGEDGGAIEWNTLGAKDDLPAFVHDFGFRCFKWSLAGTVRMETPVIYFYSARELDANVKVSFPHGLITEWYPQAEHQIFQKSRADGTLRRLAPNLNGIDTSLRTITGGMEWAHIRIQPDVAPVLPLEGSPSRYYAARGTDAAPVTVGGQQEKFLFYRGVGRFGIPLSARLDAHGKVAVENREPVAVPAVILFENQGGHIGFRNLGAMKDAVTADPPALDSNFAQLRYDLETALVAQGLYPKEAQAMVETWKDSWFEEGSRLIYVVPSHVVDAVLPLQVEPAPSAIARVFVGRIELITPVMIRTVTAAVAKLDWPTLHRYGRFLDPILARIGGENPTLKAQVERIRVDERMSIASGRCR
jgi:hypothetical protein